MGRPAPDRRERGAHKARPPHWAASESKLSADERAFLKRICSLNEEETEKLTFDELIAYFNIMHKIDPRSVRHAFEETFIDLGLTHSDVLRLLEGAKERAKWKQ
jgi:hypothetical protein